MTMMSFTNPAMESLRSFWTRFARRVHPEFVPAAMPYLVFPDPLMVFKFSLYRGVELGRAESEVKCLLLHFQVVH